MKGKEGIKQMKKYKNTKENESKWENKRKWGNENVFTRNCIKNDSEQCLIWRKR